ncbi:acyl-CoA dehydrogenase family protein [Bordetella sp. BOR01]|uniref:acyl-CoA dehydrogenase family protein n=1 Tax=Bordetella sp. BOR01 TaxID=2854779 RepID=UPI001C439A71|nr:acyl-CoA dehydrogenase family protein [Bordetella sp. BOR01]MBV7484654.1 acyl-CoA dehydrogenase family protein [Bordetella sp. BOR01]
MNFDYSAEDQAFRQTVERFIDTALPAELRHKVLNHLRLGKEDFLQWHRIVHRQGWVGASWPKEYGGTGWTAIQQHIWQEACALAGAPIILPFGVSMIGPVLMAYGSAQQKERYLPRILSGEDWWCQGYSEPGAGSDLASLSTRAERRGGHYVVNGQKAWTTFAQHANWMFCLVRTDSTVSKQKGISFLLIDMSTPGITIRPVTMLDGEQDVNEVFLDDVKVPLENLVGVENQGWTYAKFLLGHERTSIAGVGRSRRELAFLKRFALGRGQHGQPLLRDPLFGTRVAELEIDLMALELLVLQALSRHDPGHAGGPEASVMKIMGTDIQQRLTELMVDAAGPYAAPLDEAYLDGASAASAFGDDAAAPLARQYLSYRKPAVYGGSTEIQKNIVSKMILGL